MAFALAAILVVALAVYWWLRRNRSDGLSSLPWATEWYPVVGHAIALGRDPLAFMVRQLKRCGDKPFVVQALMRCIVVLPESQVRLIQRAKEDELSGEALLDLTGADFFSRPGMERGDFSHVLLLKNVFVPRRAQFVPIFVECVERQSRDALGAAGANSVTFTNFLSGFATDLVGEAVISAICGVRLGRDKSLMHAFVLESQITEAVLRLAFAGMPEFLLARKARKLAGPRSVTDAIILPEIQRRRSEGEAAGKGDFLDILMWSAEAYTDDQILGCLGSIMFAALTTTRNTFSDAVNDLSCRPQLQDEVRAEIRAALSAAGGGCVTDQVVAGLKLTEATVRESLRIRAVPILPFRKVLVDLDVGGVVVPRGIYVAAAAGAIHRSEALFAKPNEFDPHRWLEHGTADSHASFLSFGAGLHKCPGRFFALTEIKTLLACLLLNYRFSGGAFNGRRGDRTEDIPITMTAVERNTT